jgi:predicted flap endonuclease-1-like 5' DNA nuclease
MTFPISHLAVVDPNVRAKLRAAGIRTTGRLLETAKRAKDRQLLATKIDIDQKILLSIANLADRMRIKGVGQEYAELLKAAGVDTVNELRHRNPANLATRMAKANTELKLVRVLPSELTVSNWIEQARKLELMISY